jgi:hypothetical protein
MPKVRERKNLLNPETGLSGESMANVRNLDIDENPKTGVQALWPNK